MSPGRYAERHQPLRTMRDFWLLVEHPGNDEDCWLWTGKLDDWGYGYFYLGLGGTTGAHRIAFQAFAGRISEPQLHVHHVCGVKTCVNPDHLQALTPADHTRLHADAPLLRANSNRTDNEGGVDGGATGADHPAARQRA